MKPLRLQVLPSLASFGPLFIVIGLVFTSRTEPTALQTALKLTFALSGALMTSSALVIIVREIVSLRQILEAKTEEHVRTEQHSVSGVGLEM